VSAPHIDDDALDQYASGTLRPELLVAIEEHLLTCPDCQTRLIAADEFIGLFRAAATQPDARPRPLWQGLFNVRWIGAAAVVAAGFLLTFVEFRTPPMTPATVFMQSLRGPEAVAGITAGKPVRLVFDLTPTGAARDYQVQILNLLGTQVLAIPVELKNGRLSVLIQKLGFGSYWVRIYHRANGEPIAEYGLRTE
jgi:anti-sigma factor RsiW